MKFLSFFVLVLILCVGGCGSNQSENKVASAKKEQNDLIQEGLQHLKERNVIQAINSFDEAIKRNPNDLDPYLILGRTYMNLNQPDRAIDTFVAATRVAPNEPDLHYMLAINYNFKGNTKKALASAKKSAELFSQDQNKEGLQRSLLLIREITQKNQG